MIVVVLCVCFIVTVRSEVPPPLHVQVDHGLLTWAPGPGPEDTSFTVLLKSLRSDSFEILPKCERKNVTSCDVTSLVDEMGPKCVQLAVRGETRAERSETVTACSTQAGACTPVFKLMGATGSMAIKINRKHPLIDEHGGHIRHRIYFGEEGAPLEQWEDEHSASVSVPNLKEGRSYCASVQFTYFNSPVGLPSCPVCERVPLSEVNVVAIVCILVVVLALLPTLALYFMLFQKRRIKKAFLVPYHIPSDILDPSRESVSPNTPVVESYDHIFKVETLP